MAACGKGGKKALTRKKYKRKEGEKNSTTREPERQQKIAVSVGIVKTTRLLIGGLFEIRGKRAPQVKAVVSVLPGKVKKMGVCLFISENKRRDRRNGLGEAPEAGLERER